MRVATAYFNVLAAEDNLASAVAARDSVSRQLEQSQRRFEVGLIAITDVQQSQAGYDDAVAARDRGAEIAGELRTSSSARSSASSSRSSRRRRTTSRCCRRIRRTPTSGCAWRSTRIWRCSRAAWPRTSRADQIDDRERQSAADAEPDGQLQRRRAEPRANAVPAVRARPTPSTQLPEGRSWQARPDVPDLHGRAAIARASSSRSISIAQPPKRSSASRAKPSARRATPISA